MSGTQDFVIGKTESISQAKTQNNMNTNRIYVNHRHFLARNISSCTEQVCNCCLDQRTLPFLRTQQQIKFMTGLL